MMEFFKILAWLLLNVGVPMLAPIALLPLLGASEEYRYDVRKLIRRSLQEGQLFWTVIAMCAAACYEAAGHVAAPGYLEISQVFIWFSICWHVIIIIVSSVLVLLGVIDAVKNERRHATRHDFEELKGAPRIMVFSVWLSAITAVTYSATHFLAG